MKKLNDVGILCVDSIRSRAYLHCLTKAGLYPSKVLEISNANNINKSCLTKNNYFDVTKRIEDYGSKFFEYQKLDTRDINSLVVENALNSHEQTYWIYAGPSGVIVKKNILNTGKKLLHIHPGRVPGYKGSTTLYYSILLENNIYCSAFFLSEKIDDGDVICIKKFAVPENKELIDYVYDPWYRASLLVDVIYNYQENKEFKLSKQASSGKTYYIIHPLLKHLAILR